MSPIDISDYNYLLEKHQIAQYPVTPRDSSKLLVFKNNETSHHIFNSLASHLPANCTLVFNDTKVIPARLHFIKSTGAVIEVFLLTPVNLDINTAMASSNQQTWECTIGNKKKWKDGEVLSFAIDDTHIEATLTDVALNYVSFSWNSSHTFAELINFFGKTPLPPYLGREQVSSDKENYQTIYAEHQGAVAAPTAGLHFTPAVFADLQKANINTVNITLHVGSGTFQPVKVANALDHPMHSERLVFSKASIEALLHSSNGIIPVGTTSMRSLESLYWFGVMLYANFDARFHVPKLYPYQLHQDLPTFGQSFDRILQYMEHHHLTELHGSTEIMIFPSYIFRVCNAIITNFHQPCSTLLLLISALVGTDNWLPIYKEAQSHQYRFLSYGDSSLLYPTSI